MFLYHRYTLLSVRMRVALRSVKITIQEPKVVGYHSVRLRSES